MTLSSKTTRRPGWSLTTCLHLYGQSISVAFQRNILSQTDRGSTGKKCAHLLQDLGAAAALPPRSAHFPSLMFGLTGKTTTFPSSTFSPLDTTVYISIITDPGRAQVPRHTRPLAELLAAIARLLATAPAPQRTVAAHCVDNSTKKFQCEVPHLGSPQLRAHHSHASSLE